MPAAPAQPVAAAQPAAQQPVAPFPPAEQAPAQANFETAADDSSDLPF